MTEIKSGEQPRDVTMPGGNVNRESDGLKPKKVGITEKTVGGYSNWMDRLSSFVTRKKLTAAATVAATATLLGATGHMDDTVNAADNSVEKVSSLLTPDISKEFTTPQEVFEGTMNIKIDGLDARKEPNASGDKIDMSKIKLATTVYDSQTQLTNEEFLSLSDQEGFTLDNALIVHGQNLEGGAQKAKWIKLEAANNDDNEKFDVYIPIYIDNYTKIDQFGNFVNVMKKDLDGKDEYVPTEEPDRRILGEFSHAMPLVQDTPPGE
jgi:hypothetical protein